MIHQSPGLTEKHKTTHTPIGYFLASVSDSQKYRQEKRSHWARGLRWIFRGQRALSISVIYRMQENDSRCARVVPWYEKHNYMERNATMRCQLSGLHSTEQQYVCIHSSIIFYYQLYHNTSNTTSALFFSFSLRRSSNEKSSTSTFQSYPKPKIFWQMPKHLLWTV